MTIFTFDRLYYVSPFRFPSLTFPPHFIVVFDCFRCAQPMTGFRARCVEDETLMQLIGKANPQSHQVYLVDTRPVVCDFCLLF